MKTALVTGSNSGLGRAIAEKLRLSGWDVANYDLDFGYDVCNPPPIDLDRLDLLVNCAGVNIIDWLENFTEESWDAVMDINAKGIFKMTQACLPLLKESKGAVINIVSNASHMPMTCSLAYNASKGAAYIMTKQLARELTPKYGITVFGIAPNKMAGTGMSDSIDEQVVKTRGWTKEFAREYQLKGLLTGEETPPRLVAEFLDFLVSDKQRHRFLTGCILPYGA